MMLCSDPDALLMTLTDHDGSLRSYHSLPGNPAPSALFSMGLASTEQTEHATCSWHLSLVLGPSCPAWRLVSEVVITLPPLLSFVSSRYLRLVLPSFPSILHG